MTVKVDLRPLIALKNMFALASPRRRKIFKQWAFVYRTFVRRRFDTYSRSMGNWPSLSPKTIARRRTGPRARRIGRRTTMLRDTGTLYAALSPRFKGSPGALEQMVSDGVLVGFGGEARHPTGRATIADIATFHDEGKGHLPQRQIIVDPDTKALDRMRGIVIREAKRVTS